MAEEALAIAVWAALAHADPVAAMIAAANHDGDTDSTASIAGQILGTLHGPSFLPQAWLAELELKEVIERVAEELVGCT